MTFDEFSKANIARCESPQGFNHALDSWSPSDWLTAVAGELGELANVIKKLNRVRDGIPGNDVSEEQLRQAVKDEAADTFIYLDLLCQRFRFNLGQAVVDKFNQTSKKRGYPVVLTYQSPASSTPWLPLPEPDKAGLYLYPDGSMIWQPAPDVISTSKYACGPDRRILHRGGLSRSFPTAEDAAKDLYELGFGPGAKPEPELWFPPETTSEMGTRQYVWPDGSCVYWADYPGTKGWWGAVRKTRHWLLDDGSGKAAFFATKENAARALFAKGEGPAGPKPPETTLLPGIRPDGSYSYPDGCRIFKGTAWNASGRWIATWSNGSFLRYGETNAVSYFNKPEDAAEALKLGDSGPANGV